MKKRTIAATVLAAGGIVLLSALLLNGGSGSSGNPAPASPDQTTAAPAQAPTLSQSVTTTQAAPAAPNAPAAPDSAAPGVDPKLAALAQPADEAARGEAADFATLPPIRLPSLAEIRQQVRANPHQTPKGMIALASMIAVKMEAVKAAPASAGAFFDELKGCVLAPGEQYPAAQALCLNNAIALGKVDPKLAEVAQDLKRNASGPVAKLVDAFQKL